MSHLTDNGHGRPRATNVWDVVLHAPMPTMTAGFAIIGDGNMALSFIAIVVRDAGPWR